MELLFITKGMFNSFSCLLLCPDTVLGNSAKKNALLISECLIIIGVFFLFYLYQFSFIHNASHQQTDV